jgi:hypothetical protein
MPYLTVSYSDSAAIIIYCTCRIPCRTHCKGHPTRLGELKGAYWQNTGSIARTARPLQTDLNRMTLCNLPSANCRGTRDRGWQTCVTDGDDRIFFERLCLFWSFLSVNLGVKIYQPSFLQEEETISDLRRIGFRRFLLFNRSLLFFTEKMNKISIFLSGQNNSFPIYI